MRLENWIYHFEGFFIPINFHYRIRAGFVFAPFFVSIIFDSVFVSGYPIPIPIQKKNENKNDKGSFRPFSYHFHLLIVCEGEEKRGTRGGVGGEARTSVGEVRVIACAMAAMT